MLVAPMLAGLAFAVLGPGHGPWAIEPPEKHGLSTPKLEAAARAIGRLRERYCFLVFKGGALVHETYYANTSDTTYETDSLA